ncbi:MAG: hypothetical protein NT069_30060, partial [Planctomycetota bacterium]|nr:hypothetical protein [Planctomycetota bacterium]
IVLEVLDANGGESQLISLGDDVLDDLPALFRRLPDGHYRVYLREVGEATRRLLSDVQLRGGRPSDGADAGFDALPTEEEPDFPSDAAPAPGEGSQPDKEEAAIVPSANLNSEIAPPVLRGAATARVPAPGLRRSIALAAASVVAAGASSRRPWEEEVQSALEVRGAESAPVASPWLRRIRRALGQG